MKYIKELATLSVPAWKDKYISYKRMKRYIYKMEQDIQLSNNTQSNQTSRSYASSIKKTGISSIRNVVVHGDGDDAEWQPLSPSKRNIIATDVPHKTDFVVVLNTDIHRINDFFMEKKGELCEELYTLEAKVKKTVTLGGRDERKPHKTLKNEIIKLYDLMDSLLVFIRLNIEGFDLIAKKYEKVMGQGSLRAWLANHVQQQPFVVNKHEVEQLCARCEAMYSSVDHTGETLRNLKRIASKKQTVKWTFKPYIFLLALVLGIVVSLIPILHENESAHRCLGLLIFIATLWATEAMPFYATGLMIPMLIVFLRILRTPGTDEVMSAKAAASYILSHYFDHMLMLILGGFSISKAFAKYHLEKKMGSIVFRWVGSNPRYFMLGVMFMGFFLSMWMSNVTAPVLVSSVLLPVIHEMPQKARRYVKSLLLGLAFSCNIGGMATPIASPQNAIAIEAIENATKGASTISFGLWLAVCVPFCLVALLIAWLFLMWMYSPLDLEKVELPPTSSEDNKSITREQIIVLCVTVITVIGWCTLSLTVSFFGDLGIVALFPVVIFFGSGLLGKEDVATIPWHLLLLIGGGTALGQGVSLSGLLLIISKDITPILDHTSLWVTTMVFVSFVGCVTIFVSHTVAAIIILPIVAEYGVSINHPLLLVLASVIMCSGSMALPMSSFPNVNSLYTEDDFGGNYLEAIDYIKSGGVMTVICILLDISVGYGLMTACQL